MICHVIINDFEIGRRMLYILDETDFENQKNMWGNTDDLLIAMNKYELFHGRHRWCDLDIKHFHVMIVNILKIMGSLDDMERGDKTNRVVVRLTFLLCGIVSIIQEKTDSVIEMMKINRITVNDVIYDYNATLEVKISPSSPHSNLKVIVDNDC